MAWFYVVSGVSFKIVEDGETPWNVQKSIQQNETYRRLQERAKQSSLLLDSVPDDEDGVLSLFVGTELFPDRYLGVGETIVCPLRSDKDEETTALADELEQMLRAEFPEARLERQDGVIISRWD